MPTHTPSERAKNLNVTRARVDKRTTAPMMGRVLPVVANKGPNMKMAK